MVSTWQVVLWYAAITAAVGGGIFSIAAFTMRVRHRRDSDTADKARILYLASYVLMSVSIFLIAFRGLVQ